MPGFMEDFSGFEITLQITYSAQAHSPPCKGGVDAPLTNWTRSEKGADGVVSSARCSGLNISPD